MLLWEKNIQLIVDLMFKNNERKKNWAKERRNYENVIVV